MYTRRSLPALGAAFAAVLTVAGACGATTDDGATSQAPPPAAEPAAPDPPPPEPPAAVEAPEPPVEALEPPVEPSPPAADGEPVDTSDEGAPADLGAAQALLTAQAVHEAATAVEYEMFMSMDIAVAGVAMEALDDISLGRVRVVGPLTWTQYDLSGVAELGPVLPPAPPGAEMQSLEFIRNSETGESYLKLEPLLLGAPPETVGPSAADAIEESGGDIGDLWVDVSSAEAAGQFPVLDGMIEAPDLAEFLRLAEAAVDADAVLADERLGPGEVLGVPVESYRLALDLTKVAEDIPDFMLAFLGEDGAASDETAEEMIELMAQLTEPLVADVALAVGAGGEVRSLELELDFGPLLAALFGMFGELDGGAGDAAPAVEMLIGSRLDVTAFNDPELAVPLPDPAFVIASESLGLSEAPLEPLPEPVAVPAE